jgi:hypothetical protein
MKEMRRRRLPLPIDAVDYRCQSMPSITAAKRCRRFPAANLKALTFLLLIVPLASRLLFI